MQPGPLLVGASRAEQVKENVTSLDVGLGPEHPRRVDAASALPMLTPYFTVDLPRERIVGG